MIKHFYSTFVLLLTLFSYNLGVCGDRALVVITELDHRGMKELAPLYKQLEKLTWSIPRKMPSLRNIYKNMTAIRNENATKESVQDKLIQILSNPKIEAVDVILGVHGLPGRLSFYDGSIDIFEWISQFKEKAQTKLNKNELEKLGFLYNLSCYGESHNEAFLQLGFKSVIGSRLVNANAELEYPWALYWLSIGFSVEASFKMPNSEEWLKYADGPVRWLGKKQNNFMKNTDSFKVIAGNLDYQIRD